MVTGLCFAEFWYLTVLENSRDTEIEGRIEAIPMNARRCKQGVWTSVIKERHFLSIMSLCGRAFAFEV